MRVAIIGGGFTGLSAAHYLQKAGHDTVIFERAKYLGGLAGGIKNALDDPPQEWEWDLEQYYHHWFTNDNFVFELGAEIGVSDKFIIERPSTAILYHDQAYPFDSPLNLMRFPHLRLPNRLKTGWMMARLKYLIGEESSAQFESMLAHEYLKQHSGDEAFYKIWQPLLKGKFKEHFSEVNMRWFWARIFKRTPKLAYYQGGYPAFIQDIADRITTSGGSIKTSTPVDVCQPCDETNQLIVGYAENNHDQTARFDAVIVTTPPSTLLKIAPQLPEEYTNKLKQSQGIGAYALLLSLHHQVLHNTYWLSINDESWPFLALVEHTNFMPKEKYNHENIVYLGDYLPTDHPHMQLSKHALIEKFTPYIKKICPLFSQESIIRSYIFKTSYAQPIVGLNHQASILPLETSTPNLYLASMAQVYPWDRGTNYAIELGQKVSNLIINQSRS